MGAVLKPHGLPGCLEGQARGGGGRCAVLRIQHNPALRPGLWRCGKDYFVTGDIVGLPRLLKNAAQGDYEGLGERRVGGSPAVSQIEGGEGSIELRLERVEHSLGAYSRVSSKVRHALRHFTYISS